MKHSFNYFCSLVVIFQLIACGTTLTDKDFYIENSKKYNAKIVRDTWGVPHVFGETDADVAFGLAYAHAEDDFENTAENMYLYRAQMGLKEGSEGAISDYLIKALKIREQVEERYEEDLSEEVKKVIEAYSYGMNYWMIMNPDNGYNHLFPLTKIDIVSGFAIQNLFFSGVVSAIEKLQRQVEEKNEYSNNFYLNEDFVIGSNAFAVNSNKTNDGSTKIIINSHQPLEGPLAWYEAHIKSNEGLNMMGGVFPGSPFIFVGFNENLGWGFTVNKPDLSDSYKLKVNPQNDNQYLMDGEWINFRTEQIHLPVKILGPIKWTFTREAKYTIHGPVLEVGKESYALRFAGMNDIRQVDQWYALNKAKNLKEWIKAMEMRSIISFNAIYADKEDNIFFLHNSSSPKRVEGMNWRENIDGSKSEYIWEEYVDFQEIPQILNPTSGWLASTNQDPFKVTADMDNLKPQDYSPTLGLQTRMTNRAYRSIELFTQHRTIDEEILDQIKFDNKYSTNSRSYKYISKIFDIEFETEELNFAKSILEKWDLSTNYENRSAALGVCTLSPEWISEQGQLKPQNPEKSFRDCVNQLLKTYKRVDPLWSERNFMYRGDMQLPVQGGPDVLRAIYGRESKEGHLRAVGGDGLYMHISWSKNGTQQTKSIHQYGSATQNEESKHFNDQLDLYVKEQYKETYFLEEELYSNYSDIYIVPFGNE